MRWQLRKPPIWATLALTACAEPLAVNTVQDSITHTYYTEVRGSTDASGGARATVIEARDGYGRLQNSYSGFGPDTWQTFTSGGLSGLFLAGGQAGGLALLRPSPVNVSNNGGAGQITASATAAGGAGGAGGSASSAPVVTAFGGNAASAASAQNTLSQSQKQQALALPCSSKILHGLGCRQ